MLYSFVRRHRTRGLSVLRYGSRSSDISPRLRRRSTGVLRPPPKHQGMSGYATGSHLIGHHRLTRGADDEMKLGMIRSQKLEDVVAGKATELRRQRLVAVRASGTEEIDAAELTKFGRIRLKHTPSGRRLRATTA